MTPPEPPSSDKDFLSRWSQLKREEAEAERPEPATQPETGLPNAGLPEPEPDPDMLAALPRIEDIGPGTDVRGFLQAGVPRALKNAALRRAWSANPLIATYEDPARDYFWDYNTPGAMPGNSGTITARQVMDMADRITQGAPPVPSADPEAAPSPASPPPAPPPPVAEAAPTEPVPQVANKDEIRDVAPPHRHGGALPG